MEKWQVNSLLKNRIGFMKNEEIEDYRNTYLKIVKNISEEDFYWSMCNWWDDGNAPYYESWLKENWSD